MRILFVINTSKFFISHRLELAKYLISRGFQVSVATHINGDAKIIRESRIDIFELPHNRTSNIFNIFDLNREVSKIIKNEKFDYVVFVSLRLTIYCYLNFFMNLKQKYVFVISGLGSLFSGFDSSRSKVVIRKIVTSLLGLLFRCVESKVIVQNEDDRWLFKRLFNLGDDRLIKIKGSGVCKAKLNSHSMSLRNTVVMASRLLIDKGVREFIDATKLLPPEIINVYDFILYGDFDPLNPAAITEEELQIWLENSPIQVKGYSNDLEVVFSHALVTVLPSYREGLPKSVIDAMVYDCAAIVTDVPGCREVVVDGETGFYVRVGDGGHLAKALETVCKHPETIKSCGLEAGKRFEKSFNIVTVGREFEMVFRSGLESAQ